MSNYVVLSSQDAPQDPVIEIEGVRYYHAGETDIDPTHEAGDIEFTTVGCNQGLSPPQTCPTCGLVPFYRILNYSQIDASGCSACEADSGTEWDGTFGSGPNNCIWPLNVASSGHKRSGKRLLPGASWISGGGGNAWQLIIKCQPQNEEAPAPVIWFGTKSTGRTPAGEYTRHATQGGCASGPGTLMVEEVPI